MGNNERTVSLLITEVLCANCEHIKKQIKQPEYLLGEYDGAETGKPLVLVESYGSNGTKDLLRAYGMQPKVPVLITADGLVLDTVPTILQFLREEGFAPKEPAA